MTHLHLSPKQLSLTKTMNKLSSRVKFPWQTKPAGQVPVYQIKPNDYCLTSSFEYQVVKLFLASWCGCHTIVFRASQPKQKASKAGSTCELTDLMSNKPTGQV